MSPLATILTVSMSFGMASPSDFNIPVLLRTVASQTLQSGARNLDILEIDVYCRSSLAYAAEPALINRNHSTGMSGSWNMLCLLIASKTEFVLSSQEGCQ